MIVTPIYAGLLAILFFVLSLRVAFGLDLADPDDLPDPDGLALSLGGDRLGLAIVDRIACGAMRGFADDDSIDGCG